MITLIIRRKGGPGSGFHGHAGRPGKVGGSTSGVNSMADMISDYTSVGTLKSLMNRGVAFIDKDGNILIVKRGYDHIDVAKNIANKLSLSRDSLREMTGIQSNDEGVLALVELMKQGNLVRIRGNKISLQIEFDGKLSRDQKDTLKFIAESYDAIGSKIYYDHDLWKYMAGFPGYTQGSGIAEFDRFIRTKGGPGSGHHGHAGRPGKVGGSASNVSTFADLRDEFNGVPFDKEDVSIVAYRVGNIDDSYKRGIFFSEDKAGAEEYVSLHEGYNVKSYTLSMDKVLVAGHQNSVTKKFFGKTYAELMDKYTRFAGSGPGGARKLDKRIRNEAIKRGYDAIVYTSPAPPAAGEIVIFDASSID